MRVTSTDPSRPRTLGWRDEVTANVSCGSTSYTANNLNCLKIGSPEPLSLLTKRNFLARDQVFSFHLDLSNVPLKNPPRITRALTRYLRAIRLRATGSLALDATSATSSPSLIRLQPQLAAQDVLSQPQDLRRCDVKRAANGHGAKENEVYLAIEVDLACSARGVERCAKFYVAMFCVLTLLWAYILLLYSRSVSRFFSRTSIMPLIGMNMFWAMLPPA